MFELKLEKREIARKGRAFQTEGKAESSIVEREGVRLGQEPGAAAVRCAQGVAASPARPPLPCGIGTSSSRPEALGKGQGRRAGAQEGEERPPQNEPETFPTPLRTLMSQLRGRKDSIAEMVPSITAPWGGWVNFSLHPLTLENHHL